MITIIQVDDLQSKFLGTQHSSGFYFVLDYTVYAHFTNGVLQFLIIILIYVNKIFRKPLVVLTQDSSLCLLRTSVMLINSVFCDYTDEGLGVGCFLKTIMWAEQGKNHKINRKV